MKFTGLTCELRLKLLPLRVGEVTGIPCVAVKFMGSTHKLPLKLLFLSGVEAGGIPDNACHLRITAAAGT